jgi:hypothetical protein
MCHPDWNGLIPYPGGSYWYWGWGYWAGSWTYYSVQPGIKATIDVWPTTNNLGSEGNWVKCKVEFPANSMDTVNNIDLTTTAMNGIPAEANPKYGFVANQVLTDNDGDGNMELMIKFDRDGVNSVIMTAAPDTIVTVDGYTTNGIFFKGSTTWRTIHYYDHP